MFVYYLYFPVPVVSGEMVMNVNCKDSLWIDRGWRTNDTDKDSGLSEMKLLQNAHLSTQSNYAESQTDYAEVDPRNMTTFYNCRTSPDNPTPYATTMLLNGMQHEVCTNPSHSHSEHDVGSSGTNSLHSDGKQLYCAHSNKHYPGGQG